MKPRFFAKAAAFRRWLEKNHDRESELWIGFHKPGKAGMTYAEAVDQALCFGWIDGLVKSLDADSHVRRFTLRKKSSIWSAVNLRKFAALDAKNLVEKPGREAYERRDPAKTNRYSFENRPQTLPPPLEKKFRANRAAWKFFQAQPPSYHRTAIWWVVSAKRDETKLSRLLKLIAASAKGERLF